jgi:hypothetical protein
MRKLKLNVETLNVERFEPVDAAAVVRGTIEAAELTTTIETTDGPWFCPYACDCASAPSC